MSMTATAKILARHAGKAKVEPADLIEVQVDLLMMNEGTAALAIPEFEKLGVSRVWDPGRIALVNDHFVPAKDARAAQLSKATRDFARKYGVQHYFEVGRGGIEHALLPEQGLVSPGMVIIGADSHSVTYGAFGCFSTGVGSTDAAVTAATGLIWLKVPETLKIVMHGQAPPWVTGKDFVLYTIKQLGVDGARYMAMEWAGDAIDALSMDARMSMTNMAIEAGGKNGFIAPDATTARYLQEHPPKFPVEPVFSDPDAAYAAVYDWDISKLEPQVAFPHSPENVHPISAAADIRLDQVYIGSCTNGRIEDLRIAAAILKDRKVHDDLRVIVVPATVEIQKQAMREGLLEIFIDAGAAVSTPTCGACVGGHMGVLTAGEVCLSTTNRNFLGRMGDPTSQVYLASPAVAAASAVTGRITHPAAVVGREVPA